MSFKIVLGELPKKCFSSNFTQLFPDFFEYISNILSSVTSPTTYMGAFSLLHILENLSKSDLLIISPILSWDSFPIISLFDKVGSPIGSLSSSI